MTARLVRHGAGRTPLARARWQWAGQLTVTALGVLGLIGVAAEVAR